ncbi:MAG: S24 family peptidase [Pseudomonadota bacterium]
MGSVGSNPFDSLVNAHETKDIALYYEYQLHSYYFTVALKCGDDISMEMTHTAEDLREHIQWFMDRRDLNVNSWSNAAGTSEGALRNFMSGKSDSLRTDTLYKLAKAENITAADLLAGYKNETPHLHTPVQNLPDQLVEISYLPVVAGLGFGGDGTDFEKTQEVAYITADVVADLRRDPKQLLALEVRGQSMSPVLESGDRVIVDMSDKNVGNEGIFTAFDGEAVVTKWVERVPNSDPAKLRFKSYNDMSTDYNMLAEQCNIIGRVVWYARKL